MIDRISVRWLGRIRYADGLAIQDEAVAKVRSGASAGELLLLEHEPVYTIGRTRDQSSLLLRDHLPYPVHEINRGGQATWHGPGQLVGYPILDLHRHGRDLHRYLRFLELVLIDALGACGVRAQRRDGLTGVWVDEKKIASIGVGVRHWITMHGFALNVCGELDGFNHIVPCGITDVRITSIEREIGSAAPGVEEFGNQVAARLLDMLPTLGAPSSPLQATSATGASDSAV